MSSLGKRPEVPDRLRFESTRAALRGRELAHTADAVFRAWQEAVGEGGVVWVDPAGVVIRPPAPEFLKPGGRDWAELPIVIERERFGAIWVERPSRLDLVEAASSSLLARTALVTNELLLWAQTECVRRGEKIERLRHDGYTEEVAELLSLCGLPRTSGPLFVAVLEVAEGPPFQEMDTVRAFFVPRLWRYREVFPFVGNIPNGLAAFIPKDEAPDFEERLATWLDEWERGGGLPLRAVLTDAQKPALLKESLERAEAVLAVARWHRQKGLVRDRLKGPLGQLLLSLGPTGLHTYVRQVLGQLAEPEHRSLVETLFVYLEVEGSPQKAAKRLFIHRNTLRYRLQQIERMTGRSLRDMTDVAALWIALYGLALVEGGTSWRMAVSAGEER